MAIVTFGQIELTIHYINQEMLEHMMGIHTEKLDTPHEYVPWVTLKWTLCVISKKHMG